MSSRTAAQSESRGIEARLSCCSYEKGVESIFIIFLCASTHVTEAYFECTRTESGRSLALQMERLHTHQREVVSTSDATAADDCCQGNHRTWLCLLCWLSTIRCLLHVTGCVEFVTASRRTSHRMGQKPRSSLT